MPYFLYASDMSKLYKEIIMHQGIVFYFDHFTKCPHLGVTEADSSKLSNH